MNMHLIIKHCDQCVSVIIDMPICTDIGITSIQRGWLLVSAAVITVLAIIRLLMELYQFLPVRVDFKNISCTLKSLRKSCTLKIYWEYWLDPTNYLEIFLYISSMVFVAVFKNMCTCPSRWQWQIGTLAVFLSWVDLLLFLNTLPGIGIYVGMMIKIVERFLKVSILALLLTLAFGIAFFMTFFEPNIPVSTANQHMHIHTCTCMQVHGLISTHTHMYIHACIDFYSYAPACIYIHAWCMD